MYEFDTVCRTCSSSGVELHSLFDNFQFNVTEMLSDIVNIRVRDLVFFFINLKIYSKSQSQKNKFIIEFIFSFWSVFNSIH